METYGVFGGAFVARPIGGILFGILGDRKGRKYALQVSMLLMFLATFLLGCLPNYDTIGAFAPILLTILRLFQGLSVGGQLVGSMLFLVGLSVKSCYLFIVLYLYLYLYLFTCVFLSLHNVCIID